MSDRKIFAAIVYRLRTGCHWRALPDRFGSGSTCHRRFSEWVAAGVFEAMFKELLRFYDLKKGIQWDWAAMDAAIVKAPQGGALTGPNPTDRAKRGCKRHVAIDGRGVPLGVTISAANLHDKCAALPTVDSMKQYAPSHRKRPEHCCLDKGYDYADINAGLKMRGIRSHIRHRGEEPRSCRRGKPRRWKVERTNSWHTRYRTLLIRSDVKPAHYLALLLLANALIAFRVAQW